MKDEHYEARGTEEEGVGMAEMRRRLPADERKKQKKLELELQDLMELKSRIESSNENLNQIQKRLFGKAGFDLSKINQTEGEEDSNSKIKEEYESLLRKSKEKETKLTK